MCIPFLPDDAPVFRLVREKSQNGKRVPKVRLRDRCRIRSKAQLSSHPHVAVNCYWGKYV